MPKKKKEKRSSADLTPHPSDDEALDVFQTNFFGPLRLIRAVLPHMRRVGHGVIFNVAGVDAYDGGPNAGVYGASKTALATVTEALQREADPLGVRVCLVQPGHFRTPFLARGHRLRVADTVADYDMVLTPLRRDLNALNGNQPGDPRKAARAVVDLAAQDDVRQIPFLVLLGSDAGAAADKAKARLDSARRYEQTDL